MRLKIEFLVMLSLAAMQLHDAMEVTRLSSPINKLTFEASGKALTNTCPVGVSLPIWEKEIITESFCRCPDGSYGLTCTEGFGNPCANGQIYHPAHPSLPPNYFIECSQYVPYLMKCAPYTEWNQDILTCDWSRGSYRSSVTRVRPGVPVESGYGSYAQKSVINSPSPSSNYGSTKVPTPISSLPKVSSTLKSVDQYSSGSGLSSSSYGAGASVKTPAPIQASSYGGSAADQQSASYGGVGYGAGSLAKSSLFNGDQFKLASSLASSSSSSAYGSVDQPIISASQSSYGASSLPSLSQSSQSSYGSSVDQSTLGQSTSSYGASGSLPSLAQSTGFNLDKSSIKTQQSQSYGAGTIVSAPSQGYSSDQSSQAQSSSSSYGGYDSSSVPAVSQSANLNDLSSLSQSSSYGSYGSSSMSAPVPVPDFSQSTKYNDQSSMSQSASSSYGGYGSSSLPAPVPVPDFSQSTKYNDQSSLSQSASTNYGGYGSSSIGAAVSQSGNLNDLSSLRQSASSSYGSSVPVPAISQSSQYGDQSAQSSSSTYGGYGESGAAQSINDQSNLAGMVGSLGSILKQSSAYDQSAITQSQSEQQSYGANNMGSAPSYGSTQQQQSYDQGLQASAIGQTSSYGSNQLDAGLAVQQMANMPQFNINSLQNSISQKNSMISNNADTMHRKSNGKHVTSPFAKKVATVNKQSDDILVQSFEKKEAQLPSQSQQSLIQSTVNNQVSNSAMSTVSQQQQQQLVPQEIDLKRPENFISFFRKVIEPRLQAKSATTTMTTTEQQQQQQLMQLQQNSITATGAASSSANEAINLLAPTVNTQQVSSTQQLFRFDIPFAKSSTSDPNCKIPNGASIGISFTFF